MCGIAGTLTFRSSNFVINDEHLVRMRDAMAHRGPDGKGNWISADRTVGLAHRRLSIIDLSDDASQPMSNADGSFQIVFNGEIYNHAEIRRELDSMGGHRWHTDHSDTEVIIHAYEQWGLDCLNRFHGMFAFALWDSKVKKLWLVRDRLGIKPLYYSVHHGRISFASEIKALLTDPEQPHAMDDIALHHYLSFMTTPAPMTMFAGIFKLEAGCWLRVNEDGDIEKRRWWDMLDHTFPLIDASEEDIVEQLRGTLRNAVRMRKVSDVPMGVFLSGGIDSSTNAALFSEGESQPVKTFSVGYDRDYGSYVSELTFARQVAQKFHTDHHEVILTQQHLLDFLPQMIHSQDEPIADPVCVPLYYVSKLARDNGVSVCHVGEGADELFCGYPRWNTMIRLAKANALPVPKLIKQLALRTIGLISSPNDMPYEWLRRGTEGIPPFWSSVDSFTDAHKSSIYSQHMKSMMDGRSSWEALKPIWERFQEKAWEPTPLNWMTYSDLNLRLPELLLMRVDKMSMAVGLEGRVPFLDHQMVELAMSIPTAIKTHHNDLKYILKKAVRGLIPDSIIDRPKRGFGVPLLEWFQSGLSNMAEIAIQEFAEQSGALSPTLFTSGANPMKANQKWILLNVALWWKHFVQGVSITEIASTIKIQNG